MPITIKSLYTKKVTELKKNIGFYKKQCKYTDDMINKLKEQKSKLINTNKNINQKIIISQKFLEGSTTTKFKSLNRPQSSIGTHKVVLKDDDIINNLRTEYKTIKENELILEKKANIYYEKLREIDLENEEKERKEKEKEEALTGRKNFSSSVDNSIVHTYLKNLGGNKDDKSNKKEYIPFNIDKKILGKIRYV